MAAPLTESTLDRFFPPGCVLAPRAREASGMWLTSKRWRLDAMTAGAFAVMGGLPVIAHAGAWTPAVQQLFAAAGIAGPGEVRTYATEADFLLRCAEASRAGERLVQQYTAPEDPPDGAFLVAPSLRARLNDKGALSDWVPETLRLARRVLPVSAWLDGRPADLAAPIALKASTALGSGGGRAVRLCRDEAELAQALDYFRAHAAALHGLVAEAIDRLDPVWCINYAISEQRAEWIGACRQWIDAHGIYRANLFDAQQPCPDALVRAGLAVAQRAGDAGYRGIAGVDAAFDPSGAPRIFDLNFRLCASTAPLLAWRGERLSALRQPFLCASLQGRRDPVSLLRTLSGPIRESWLIPLGAFDARAHADPAARSSANVLVLGRSEAECLQRFAGLEVRARRRGLRGALSRLRAR